MSASLNPGDTMVYHRDTLKNRTGGTLSVGEIVCKNLAFAATAGQAMVSLEPSNQEVDSASGYINGAAIVPTVEAAARWVGIVESDSAADNGNVVVVDEAEFVYALVADGTNAGEFLVATATKASLTPYTLTELSTLGTAGDTTVEVVGVVGMAWESNSSGAAALKLIKFWGRKPDLVTRT